ncbi:MAG: cytochrome C oxidase subunit IV family protein [Anaerolineales bacterium]
MEAKVDEKLEEKKRETYRRGVAVIILLFFLTLSEYWLGVVAYAWWAVIFAIAIIKAFFVVRDYMHIGRLFETESEVEA